MHDCERKKIHKYETRSLPHGGSGVLSLNILYDRNQLKIFWLIEGNLDYLRFCDKVSFIYAKTIHYRRVELISIYRLGNKAQRNEDTANVVNRW